MNKKDKEDKKHVYTTLDPSLVKRKSLFMAFVCWLIGGLFGLHHFYLHRDRHAFITWATLAGYFGFGWLIDLFKLSDYVKDYNEDVDYIEDLIHLMKRNAKPPASWYRLIGSQIVANVFGYLLQASIPIEYFADEENSLLLKLVYTITLPFAVAVGKCILLFDGLFNCSIAFALSKSSLILIIFE